MPPLGACVSTAKPTNDSMVSQPAPVHSDAPQSDSPSVANSNKVMPATTPAEPPLELKTAEKAASEKGVSSIPSLPDELTSMLSGSSLSMKQIIAAVRRAEMVAAWEKRLQGTSDTADGSLLVLSGAIKLEKGLILTNDKFPTFTIAGPLRSVGKLYYEVEVEEFIGEGPAMFGWATADCVGDGMSVGAGCDKFSWALDCKRAQLFHTEGENTLKQAKEEAAQRKWGRRLVTGDVLGVAVDASSGLVSYSMNDEGLKAAYGREFDLEVPAEEEDKEAWCKLRTGPLPRTPLRPVLTTTSSWKIRVNFGQRAFKYLPNGYSPAYHFKQGKFHTNSGSQLDEGSFEVEAAPAANQNGSHMVERNRAAFVLTLAELIGVNPNTPLDDPSSIANLACFSEESFESRCINKPKYASAFKEIVADKNCVIDSQELAWMSIECINYGAMMGREIASRQISHAPMIWAFSTFLHNTRETYAQEWLSKHNNGKSSHSFPGIPEAETFSILDLSKLKNSNRQWQDVLKPDKTGTRGFTAFETTMALAPSSLKCEADGENGELSLFADYSSAIFAMDLDGEEPLGSSSNLVRFLYSPESESGVHNPIALNEQTRVFPPFTLFHVLSVDDFLEVEGQRFPVTTINVMATFRTREMEKNEIASKMPIATKMNGSSEALIFGSRSDYARGIGDVLLNPMCSLEEEWNRDFEFEFWNVNDRKTGKTNAKEQWAYINSPVPASTDAANLHDKGHEGMSLADFKQAADELVRSHAKQQDWERLYLSMEEVAALRLFTGPGFVPINSYLREICKLSRDYRKSIVPIPEISWSATCDCVNNAVHKLAQLPVHSIFKCKEEDVKSQSVRVYRGVRGHLPTNWQPDSQNYLCCSHYAFMSTSIEMDTPLAYMEPETDNVLFEFILADQDVANHMGADVSFVSQYPGEKEILFPPMTMLIVPQRDEEALQAAASRQNSILDDELSQRLEKGSESDYHGDSKLPVPSHLQTLSKYYRLYPKQCSTNRHGAPITYDRVEVIPYFV